MMAQHPPPTPTQVPGEEPGQTQPLYCRRCSNPRPLGLVAPGRYWTRHHGRTVLVQGGRVKVWCERCQKQHDLDLDMV